MFSRASLVKIKLLFCFFIHSLAFGRDYIIFTDGVEKVIDISSLKFNFSQKNLFFNMKIEDMENLKNLTIIFKSSDKAYVYNYPIYEDYFFNLHQNCEDGRISIGSIHLDKVVNNNPIEKMIVTANSKNGEKKSIHINELKSLNKIGEGIVTLTFDDGYADNYMAAKIASQYNIKATTYIMPRQINLPGYLTTFELLDIYNTRKWDVQFHHAKPIVDMSSEEFMQEMNFSLNFFQNHQLIKSETGKHFAYPLGRWTPKLKTKTIEFFKTGRVAGGKYETIPPADQYLLRTFNVLGSMKAQDLIREVEKSIEHRQWVIFMFHHIKDGVVENHDQFSFSKQEFEKFLKYLSTKEKYIKTMSEAWSESVAPNIQIHGSN